MFTLAIGCEIRSWSAIYARPASKTHGPLGSLPLNKIIGGKTMRDVLVGCHNKLSPSFGRRCGICTALSMRQPKWPRFQPKGRPQKKTAIGDVCSCIRPAHMLEIRHPPSATRTMTCVHSFAHHTYSKCVTQHGPLGQ
jgi:hypothetical protein